MSTIIQTSSNLYLLSFWINFLLHQKLRSVLSNYANYLYLVSSHNVLASQLNTHSRLLNQPVSPSSAIMKCVWYCRLLTFSRKPSKLAYRKILCDTATTVFSRRKKKRAYRFPFSTWSLVVDPLIPFSVSASVRAPPVTLVCPQEVETRKAVSGNISTNLPGRIRDLLFAGIPLRDVYFVIEELCSKRTETKKTLVCLHGADTG